MLSARASSVMRFTHTRLVKSLLQPALHTAQAQRASSSSSSSSSSGCAQGNASGTLPSVSRHTESKGHQLFALDLETTLSSNKRVIEVAIVQVDDPVG